MKIRCIAVDDEPLALDILEDYIHKVPFLELLKTFLNALECIDFLKNNKVDLLFLDIQMEELTGIQLIRVLKEKPEIIFTTAYDAYALQGYELDVTDYLLKPISFERFVKSVDKVYDKMSGRSHPSAPLQEVSIYNPKNDFFFVKTEFRLQKVDFRDIQYIEGMGDYLRIVTLKERIMTLQNFKNMEDILPADQFVRVHRSYIVSIDKILSIERNRIKIADTLIPIGENYKKNFFGLLENGKML
ncbi:MAG: LytTR family DNA-binding domain-containing protein [Bacteroidetes bacterium]|nr:LytTR family DNA-binding domain-containing protein [Bacteroidota bacterium]